MPRTVQQDEIERVFEGWRARQRRPQACRLTDDRVDLLRSRLSRGYSVEDLLALFEYAWNADTAEARFWRGDNARRRTYLDLSNLLRAGKLAGRVESARNWIADRRERTTDHVGLFRLSDKVVRSVLPTESERRLELEPRHVVEDEVERSRRRHSDSLGRFRLVGPGGEG